MTVWHPFTQHAVEPPPPRIIRTDGASLYTDDGRTILDAIASWWVITHGHRHERIMAAIRDATEQLDQIIFAGLTHAPAEALAAGLLRMAPSGLSHVFYSDSGSTSVEVAIKMAIGFHRHTGAPRTRIAVLEHGYHGDTIGTMSVGERGVYNQTYAPLLFDVDTLPFPAAGQETRTLERFAALARNRGVAALVIEPLLLGAGGMLTYPAETLRQLAVIAAETGTLLIADEVLTGWGRTGTRFACEQAGITPDLLCTSKGLTGGALPLAATLSKPAIFDAHHSQDRSRTLFHSSSYTANPIACAAALANLEVWQTEPVADRVATLCERQGAARQRFAADARFSAVRQCGTIIALDLRVRDDGYLSTAGPALRAFCLERDVLLRPLGNTLYVMPPYCISPAELDRIYDTIDAAADFVAA